MISLVTAKAIFQSALLSGGSSPYDPGSQEHDIWQCAIETREHEKSKAQPRRAKKEKSEKYRIATIDFETDPAGAGRHIEPFAWGFYNGSEYHHYWGSDAARRLVDFIRDLEEPHILYAHNGGKFDFQFIVEWLERDILFIGSRITVARISGCKFEQEIRDSLAIIPVPLKEAGEKFEFDYEKMRAGRRDKHKREILEYLKQDCVGLYDTIIRYRQTFGNAITMASAAMKELNKAMCPEGHPAPHSFRVYQRMTERMDATLRPWYFGGRVQCFRKGIIDAPLKIYDITSSYPYAMLSQMHPVGATYEITKDITDATDFALVDAHSEGCLPMRAQDWSLSFPHGRFTFHASIHEIRAGLQTGQLKIMRVLHARECREKTTFQAFIEKFFNLRLEAKATGDGVFDLFWKLVMNGAYGKFAQNPRKFRDHELVIEGEEPPSLEHGWTPEYLTEQFTIYSRLTEQYFPGSSAKSFLNVGTGASITAAARAHLMRALAVAQGAVYCDTDSIVCEALPPAMLENGAALGGWKLEAEGNRIAICEKKLYAFFGKPALDLKTRKERIAKYGDVSCIKIASKGVRLKATDILDVARGETVTYHPVFPTIKPDGRQIYTQRKIRMRG
jgi:hypothetical protein